MPNSFGRVASVDNNVVALPVVDTKHILQTADYFNPDALVEREVIKGIAPYYNYRDILAQMELTNRIGTTHDLQVKSYEQGAPMRPVKIGAVVGSATAASAIVTLSADSYRNHAELGGTIARSSLIKDFVVRFVNGTTALVRQKGVAGTSGVNTQFELARGAGSTADIAAAIAAQGSIPLMAFTNAYGEGTASPTEGLEQGTTMWRNYAQILKTYRNATGDANALKIIDHTGKTKYYDKQAVEMTGEHRIFEKFAVWFGTGEVFNDADGVPVQQCVGVDTAIQTMGNVYNYTRGTFAKADLDALVAQIKAMNGGGVYMWHAGYELFAAIQNVIRDLIGQTGQTGIDFSNFGEANSRKKMVDLGFMSFVYGGITFHLIESDLLSLPELTGIAGYKYPANGYLLQDTGQSIDVQENGRMTKLIVPSLSLRYTTEYNGEMRRYSKKTRDRGITGVDRTIQEMLTQVCPQIVNTRKMFLINAV